VRKDECCKGSSTKQKNTGWKMLDCGLLLGLSRTLSLFGFYTLEQLGLSIYLYP
jgi:hypothetical protein